jgi:hypothetical protein
MDPMDAWNKGYGEKSRKLAMDVLKSDPGNSYAHGFLAVWNLEVRRRAGSIRGAFMGASVKEAQRRYEKAAHLAPDFVGIHWSYGRALVALDAKEHAEEANGALSAAISASADDHVEEVMQERARVLAEALRNDPNAAQTLARKIL